MVQSYRAGYKGANGAFPSSSGWTTLSKNYDVRGNIIFQDQPDKDGESGLRSYSYLYDAYGRVTKIYEEENLDVGETNFSYAYSSGNLTTATSKVSFTPSTTQVSSTVTDAVGKIISSTD